VIIDRSTSKDTLGGYTDSGGNTTTKRQSNRIPACRGRMPRSITFRPIIGCSFDSYNTRSVKSPVSELTALWDSAVRRHVNQSTAQAELNRDTNQISLAPTTTDLPQLARDSRSLIKDKLAIYAAFLYNNQQFPA